MTSIQSSNITEKLMQHKNYELLTQNEIKHEHQQLLVYLRKINQNLNKKLNKRKFSYFTKPKPALSMAFTNIKIIQQQLLAGEKLLNNLSYEYRKLQIRKKQITLPDARISYDEQIQGTKTKINDVIKSMKEIKRQNILREKKLKINKIDNDVKELRDLELQFYLMEGRKDAIQQKIEEARSQNKNIINGLDQINEKLQNLEQNVKKIQYLQQQDNNLNQAYQNYKSKIALIEALGKKRDLLENNYKNQYFKKLKKLQIISNNQQIHLQNIALVNKKLEISRKQIQILKEKLNLPKPAKNQTYLEDNLDHIGFMVTEISDINPTTRYPKQSNRILTQGNQIIKIKSYDQQISEGYSKTKYLSEEDSYEYDEFEEYIQEQIEA